MNFSSPHGGNRGCDNRFKPSGDLASASQSVDLLLEPVSPEATSGTSRQRTADLASALREDADRSASSDVPLDPVNPLLDPFTQTRSNQIAAQSGYNARHQHLITSTMAAADAARPMTEWTRSKLNAVLAAVREGAGQGREDAYKPWLSIRRNFSSPVSHHIAESVGINARNHHFLSKLEFRTALLIAYLDVSKEFREGLPMWPFEHPHPGEPLGSTRVQPAIVPGLLDIASEAGIEHGYFVGTKVPYIGTVDQMHTLASPGPRDGLLGVSCKPGTHILHDLRSQERLELDRRYCLAIGAHHVIEHGHDFDGPFFKVLLKQLRDYKPLTSEIRSHRGTQRLIDFAGCFEQLPQERALSEAICAAGYQVGLDANSSYLFFRLSAWLHLVDVDLTQPLQMSRPIRRGSAHVLNVLRQRYLGKS